MIYRGINRSRALPSSALPCWRLIPAHGLPCSRSAIHKHINITVACDGGVRDVSCGDKSVHQRSLRKCHSERWTGDRAWRVLITGLGSGTQAQRQHWKAGARRGLRAVEARSCPLPSFSLAVGCSQGLCLEPSVKASLGPATSLVHLHGLQPLGHLFPAEV